MSFEFLITIVNPLKTSLTQVNKEEIGSNKEVPVEQEDSLAGALMRALNARKVVLQSGMLEAIVATLCVYYCCYAVLLVDNVGANILEFFFIKFESLFYGNVIYILLCIFYPRLTRLLIYPCRYIDPPR